MSLVQSSSELLQLSCFVGDIQHIQCRCIDNAKLNEELNMDFPPLQHGIERRSWFTCLQVEFHFLYSGKEGSRNVLNRHEVCPPRVTACPYFFALFSLGGDGRGRKVSCGNVFSSLHLHSFRSSLPQKNTILKLMILNAPSIKLLALSPPS